MTDFKDDASRRIATYASGSAPAYVEVDLETNAARTVNGRQVSEWYADLGSLVTDSSAWRSVPSDAMHELFELTHANCVVLWRTLMQSMPDSWQHRMADLLEEYRASFPEFAELDTRTEVGEWTRPHALGTVGNARRFGLSGCDADDPGKELPDDYPARSVDLWYDDRGNELDYEDTVFVPGVNPIPPYDRGRAFVPPLRSRTGP